MKKEIKIIFTVVAVLAVLQIAGGIFYTAYTYKKEKSYTYVDCTVLSVETEKSEDSDDTLIVKGVTVSYVNKDGQTAVAKMKDFPSGFKEGSVFKARYSDDPCLLSVETTDWFTPICLLVLGISYAAGDLIFLLVRKKLGLYAFKDANGDDNLQDVDTDENESENSTGE